MLKKLDLHVTLSDLGLEEKDIPWMAENCMKVSAASVANNPVVFTEAMILNVPIITTDVAGAEQLRGNHGIITTREVNDIYKTMKKAINNQFKIKEKFDYEEYNAKIKQQLIKLIEEGKR